MAAAARGAPAPRGDWFSKLFGFAEGSCDEVRSWLRVVPPDAAPGEPVMLESLANGALLGAGAFETPSLAELRTRGGLSLLPGRLTVSNELGDVAAKHALPENRHATFQVASQFNCLEFVGPSVVPEDGITGYASDRTQGPACSIACGPATAFRNYFAQVPGSASPGQTRHRQIENLADLSRLLGNVPCGKLFDVRGGYTLAGEPQLRSLDESLRRLEREGRLDELRSQLRVGVHADAQVTATDWGRRPVEDPGQRVTQVFGSACSVAYNRGAAGSWKGFASIVLEASYEATLWAALLNAQRHRGAGGSRRVFLTCLGGGAFGNPLEWITQAMRSALARFADQGLDVRIVTYAGAIHPQLLALERDFAAARLAPALGPKVRRRAGWPATALPEPVAASTPALGARGAKREAEQVESPAAAGKLGAAAARALVAPAAGAAAGHVPPPLGAPEGGGAEAGAAGIGSEVLEEACKLGYES